MAQRRPFKSEQVIDERICINGLKAYHIGFDQKEFRLQPLVDVIRKVIPEFAFGFHEGTCVAQADIVDRLKEAASTVYDTDKFKKRGEFGELILHLLLRDFHNTIPLVSTIYFKDSPNVPGHGFDGVQVTVNGDEKKLWLGESKLYKTGKAGIRDLIGDIKKHVQGDYMRKQFNLISRKIPSDAVEIDHWRQLLDKHQKLDTVFKSIVIPMVCTYSSGIFSKHSDNTKEYFKDFDAECHELNALFQQGKTVANIEIILLLMPVPDKDILNSELHKRLKAMQSI